MFPHSNHLFIHISKKSWTIIPRYLRLPKVSHLFVIMIMLFIWFQEVFLQTSSRTDIPMPKRVNKYPYTQYLVVDRVTKYAHFCALSHPFKDSTISTAFMEQFKSYMETQILLWSRDIPFSLGIFGRNYFLVWVLI